MNYRRDLNDITCKFAKHIIDCLLACLLACLLGWADNRTRPRIITPNHKIAKSPNKSNYFQFMGWYLVQVLCSSYLIVFLMRFLCLTTFSSTAIFAKQSEWFSLPPMKSTRWLTHKNYLIIMRISAFSHSISSICRLSFSYSTFPLFDFSSFLSPFIPSLFLLLFVFAFVLIYLVQLFYIY